MAPYGQGTPLSPGYLASAAHSHALIIYATTSQPPRPLAVFQYLKRPKDME